MLEVVLYMLEAVKDLTKQDHMSAPSRRHTRVEVKPTLQPTIYLSFSFYFRLNTVLNKIGFADEDRNYVQTKTQCDSDSCLAHARLQF